MGREEELIPARYELYPTKFVQLGWNNTDWSIGAGMVNMGNTCYLNSMLQALFHVPALVNWLMSEKRHKKECGGSADVTICIICAMRRTLQDSQQPNINSIRPYLIYNKLGELSKNLIPGRQEDAHEFLRYLVEAMRKAYLHRFKNNSEFDSRVKETTPLHQILGGYLRSTVNCLDCGNVSTTFQHFQDLLLDIREVDTLDEALENYFAKEELEDDSYQCETCQRKRLDMTKYVRRHPVNFLVYKLVALVTHMGRYVGCGHYTAIGQAPSGNYYQFDDSAVTPITLQEVFSTTAYILMYELDCLPITQTDSKIKEASPISTVTQLDTKESLISTTHHGDGDMTISVLPVTKLQKPSVLCTSNGESTTKSTGLQTVEKENEPMPSIPDDMDDSPNAHHTINSDLTPPVSRTTGNITSSTNNNVESLMANPQLDKEIIDEKRLNRKRSLLLHSSSSDQNQSKHPKINANNDSHSNPNYNPSQGLTGPASYWEFPGGLWCDRGKNILQKF